MKKFHLFVSSVAAIGTLAIIVILSFISNTSSYDEGYVDAMREAQLMVTDGNISNEEEIEWLETLILVEIAKRDELR